MAGITLEYKKSDEYKEWYSAIKAEHPELPDLLVDYAIAFHKGHPKAYKAYSKQHGKEPPKPRTAAGPKQFVVEDAVKVYDPEEAPPADMVKVVEK